MRPICKVTSEELSFALAVGSAAAAGQTPLSGVGGMGINVDLGDGDVRDIRLVDNPHNRAMIAIRDQFPRDKFKSVMFRTWALGSLMKDSRMDSFTRASEDGDPKAIEVHEAVIEIAATMPLNKKGVFNDATFFRRVAARRQELDAAEQLAA